MTWRQLHMDILYSRACLHVDYVYAMGLWLLINNMLVWIRWHVWEGVMWIICAFWMKNYIKDAYDNVTWKGCLVTFAIKSILRVDLIRLVISIGSKRLILLCWNGIWQGWSDIYKHITLFRTCVPTWNHSCVTVNLLLYYIFHIVLLLLFIYTWFTYLFQVIPELVANVLPDALQSNVVSNVVDPLHSALIVNALTQTDASPVLYIILIPFLYVFSWITIFTFRSFKCARHIETVLAIYTCYY